VQPNLAPICFADHGRQCTLFTSDRLVMDKVARFSAQINLASGGADQPITFCGRLGTPISQRITTRSIRLDLKELAMSLGTPP